MLEQQKSILFSNVGNKNNCVKIVISNFWTCLYLLSCINFFDKNVTEKFSTYELSMAIKSNSTDI